MYLIADYTVHAHKQLFLRVSNADYVNYMTCISLITCLFTELDNEMVLQCSILIGPSPSLFTAVIGVGKREFYCPCLMTIQSLAVSSEKADQTPGTRYWTWVALKRIQSVRKITPNIQHETQCRVITTFRLISFILQQHTRGLSREFNLTIADVMFNASIE